MAVSGSKKALSKEHEDYVAGRYGGRRSPSSGAAWTDLGDVKHEGYLIECKGQFGERAGENSVRSTLLQQFEKIFDEASQGDRIPAVALRFYKPESALADNNGYVDLIVKTMDDDIFGLQEARARGTLEGFEANAD
jgi:hypothetical protein